jgi:hypothetical protein
MARIRIPVEQLPPPNQDGDHVFQFRIISEDRNRTSPWSNFYQIKSVGQYRPEVSSVVNNYPAGASSNSITLVWDTPTVYNVGSGTTSIVHNHSENFKKHATDIFIKYSGGSWTGTLNWQYHDRVSTDSTSISIPSVGNDPIPSKIYVIGLVATKGIPYDLSGTASMNSYVDQQRPLFKVFETQSGGITI